MHVIMVNGIGGRLFHAPVNWEKSQRVLDIGTGTGICEPSRTVMGDTVAILCANSA
jgi:hypothetical protein